MYSVNTTFFPFRLSLRDRKPVQLKVELINRNQQEKMVSLELLLSRQLALDKSGLKATAIHRITSFKPNERKEFFFEIFPEQFAEHGTYPVRVKVLQHYQNFDLVEREFTKNLELTVQD